jgi:hypothetical protein
VSGREGEEERSVSELQKKEKKRGGGEEALTALRKNIYIYIYIYIYMMKEYGACRMERGRIAFPKGATWHVRIPMFYFSLYFIYLYIN